MLLRIEDTDRERSTEARDRRDPRRADLARPRLGRRRRLPVRPRRAPPRGRRGAAGRGPRLSLLRHAGGARRRCARRARAEGRPPRYDGRWRDRDPSEAPAGRQAGDPPAGAARGRDRGRGRGPGPGRPGRTRTSTTSCCCARTARRPTCSPSWSTTTTWASPTSSAATTISPTPPARRRSTQALGWDVPQMAHIPLIHGPDGAKLSKRHGALGVEAYRDMGYLPAALRNYLVRLGWSHGDQEVFSTEEMIAAFDLGSDRPLAGALRLRQAREPQRPLHPRQPPMPTSSAAIEAILPNVGAERRPVGARSRPTSRTSSSRPCRA